MTAATLSPVGLAALWRLLSLGLTPPTTESLAEVEALAEGLEELGGFPEIADVLDALGRSTTDELAAQFFELFGGTVHVAPYEGSYELDPIRQGRQMADVSAFYRAFGAEPAGPAAERPDHAGCELEFLSFLELRRLAAVEADEEGADLVEEIGDTFLADHAGRWLPTFFADVEREAATAPFYRALAVLGARVMSEQLELRGIEPSPLPRRRTRSSVERDSFECGAGTEAAGDAPRSRGRRGL